MPTLSRATNAAVGPAVPSAKTARNCACSAKATADKRPLTRPSASMLTAAPLLADETVMMPSGKAILARSNNHTANKCGTNGRATAWAPATRMISKVSATDKAAPPAASLAQARVNPPSSKACQRLSRQASSLALIIVCGSPKSSKILRVVSTMMSVISLIKGAPSLVVVTVLALRQTARPASAALEVWHPALGRGLHAFTKVLRRL